MKQVLCLIYPKYADFQIAHTLFLLKKFGKITITTASIDGKAVESIGSLKTEVDIPLHKVDVANYDLILLPGGDGIADVLHEEVISLILKNAAQATIPIASICGAAALLAKAEVLKGKKFTCFIHTVQENETIFELATYTGKDIEVDEQIITAKGTAFAELAVSVGEQLTIFSSSKQKDTLYNFCKGISRE